MRTRVDHLMYAAGDGLRNTIRTGVTLTEPIDAQALREAVDLGIAACHFEAGSGRKVRH